MKKVLNLVDPPITSYPSIANILSMKWKDQEEIIPWLADHFIQLMIRPHHEDTPADYYDHADIDNYFRELYGMPWLNWMRVNSEMAYFSKFTDYIEYQIDRGFGLEPCLDRFYFDFTSSYKKDHFIHSSFIYGYDNLRRKVYIVDFWDYGKYEKREVSYKYINKSMNNNCIINLFKLQDARYDFNLSLMKMFLSDYLNSRDSTSRFIYSHQPYNKDVIWGLKYYDYVKEYCSQIEIDLIDIRFFHILYDHKKLMKMRLDYLITNHIICEKNSEAILDESDNLINVSLELRNLVIKYNCTKSEKILERIVNRIDDLKKMDKKFIKNILSLLDVNK